MKESNKADGGADLPEDGAHGESAPEPQPDPASGSGADPLPDDGPAAETEERERPAERRSAPGSQAEQDAIFKELVASFNAPVDSRTWPESEDLHDAREDSAGTGGLNGPDVLNSPDALNGLGRLADFAPQPRPRPETARPDSDAPAGPRNWDAAEDPDEGHFVPPEPPPLPHADVTTKFAWIAVLGGPALLLFSALMRREISGWPAVLGVTAFIGGFVTLVARMKDRDEDDDDPHGGAVV